MQVVQVRGKSETFNSTLDVLLDMRGGIVDFMIVPVTFKYIEPAFRCNYPRIINTEDGLLKSGMTAAHQKPCPERCASE